MFLGFGLRQRGFGPHDAVYAAPKLAKKSKRDMDESTGCDRIGIRYHFFIERFVERGRKGGPFGPRPAFGALSTKEWGRVVYLHCDHHLRQFGA
jgi:hypothetical protein